MMNTKPDMMSRQAVIAIILWLEMYSFLDNKPSVGLVAHEAFNRIKEKDLRDTLNTVSASSVEAAVRAYKRDCKEMCPDAPAVAERVQKVDEMVLRYGHEKLAELVRQVVTDALSPDMTRTEEALDI